MTSRPRHNAPSADGAPSADEAPSADGVTGRDAGRFEAFDGEEFFVRQIAESQSRLFGYIFSLVGDHTRASDVLQETNLVLWRKKGQFRTGEPFLPWAFAIARFQVLANLRDRGREKCLFDDDLVSQIAGEVERQAEDVEAVQLALRSCLGKLSPAHRDLIRRRYYRAASIKQIAQELDRGASAVKVGLLRIRRQLALCVEQQLAGEN